MIQVPSSVCPSGNSAARSPKIARISPIPNPIFIDPSGIGVGRADTGIVDTIEITTMMRPN